MNQCKKASIMKTKYNSLIVLSLITWSTPSQTGILSKTACLISPVALYASVKIVQAEGDFNRARRLARIDKDNTINTIIELLKKNESDFTEELIKFARRRQSSITQQIEDRTLEQISPALKDFNETYQATKNIIDEAIKKNSESKK